MLIHFGPFGDELFGKVLGGAGARECSFISVVPEHESGLRLRYRTREK